MMKSKKGVEMPATTALLLVILAVVMIILLLFVSDLGGLIKDSGSAAACSISLIEGKGSVSCPIDNVVIGLEKGSLNPQEMAKEALARMLKDCLARGGGYNSKAFSRENYASDEVVCLECSNFKIDEAVGNLEGFTDYLRDTKVMGYEKKYLNVLTRDPEHLQAYMEYGMARNLAPSAGTFTFKPNQQYTIFFMGIKKGEIFNIWNKIKDFVSGEFFKSFVGNNDAYFSYIVESSRLSEVCDRKVN